MIETDENFCDIVFFKSNKISRRHCYLTFDRKRRLILRDLSINEIIVTYDEQDEEKRRTIVTKNDKERKTSHHFTWILNDVELNEINIKSRILSLIFSFLSVRHIRCYTIIMLIDFFKRQMRIMSFLSTHWAFKARLQSCNTVKLTHSIFKSRFIFVNRCLIMITSRLWIVFEMLALNLCTLLRNFSTWKNSSERKKHSSWVKSYSFQT
jgi:hypothetical protein